MGAPPPPKEIMEFKFSLISRVRIFPADQRLNRECPLHLVAAASKYGLVFAGSLQGVTCFPLASILSLQNEIRSNREYISSFPQRSINLGKSPTHVLVSSDQAKLGVCHVDQNCPVLSMYSIPSFATETVQKICDVRLSSTPGTRVSDIQWNPGSPNMLAAVVSDGSVIFCDMSGTGPTIKSLPASTSARCLCWSPKGKQVVIGDRNGVLTQYHPDSRPVKNFQPPGNNNQLEVLSVWWLSNYQFIALYNDKNEAKSSVFIVDVPKTGVSYTCYGDICFSSDTRRPEHYFIHLSQWNIILMGVGNGLEANVLSLQDNKWMQWIQQEAGRAELPLTENYEEVFNIGMTLDTSSQTPVPIGENSIPPMPYLLMMSDAGVVCIFQVINCTPTAATTVCQPPQPFSAQFFRVADATPVSSAPEAPRPATSIVSSVPQNVTLTAPQFNTNAGRLAPATSSISFPFSQEPAPSMSPFTQQTTQISSPKPTQAVPAQSISTPGQPPTPQQPAQVFGTLQAPVSAPLQIPSPPKRADPPKPEVPDYTADLKAANDEFQAVQKLCREFKAKISAFNLTEVCYPERINAVEAMTYDLQQFEKALKKETGEHRSEVQALRGSLLEMFGWVENIKAKIRKSNSNRYLEAVESAELDPVTKKHMLSIEQNSLYIEALKEQAIVQLNSLWNATKDPDEGTLAIPALEAVYQTIVCQTRILAALKARIDKLEEETDSAMKKHRSKAFQLNDTSLAWNDSLNRSRDKSIGDNKLERLADQLLRTKLSSSLDESIRSKSTRYIIFANSKKKLNPEKEASLQQWIKGHKIVKTAKRIEPCQYQPQKAQIPARKVTAFTPPAQHAKVPIAKTVPSFDINVMSFTPKPAPSPTVKSSTFGPTIPATVPAEVKEVSKPLQPALPQKSIFTSPTTQTFPSFQSPIQQPLFTSALKTSLPDGKDVFAKAAPLPHALDSRPSSTQASQITITTKPVLRVDAPAFSPSPIGKGITSQIASPAQPDEKESISRSTTMPQLISSDIPRVFPSTTATSKPPTLPSFSMSSLSLGDTSQPRQVPQVTSTSSSPFSLSFASTTPLVSAAVSSSPAAPAISAPSTSLFKTAITTSGESSFASSTTKSQDSGTATSAQLIFAPASSTSSFASMIPAFSNMAASSPSPLNFSTPTSGFPLGTTTVATSGFTLSATAVTTSGFPLVATTVTTSGFPLGDTTITTSGFQLGATTASIGIATSSPISVTTVVSTTSSVTPAPTSSIAVSSVASPTIATTSASVVTSTPSKFPTATTTAPGSTFGTTFGTPFASTGTTGSFTSGQSLFSTVPSKGAPSFGLAATGFGTPPDASSSLFSAQPKTGSIFGASFGTATSTPGTAFSPTASLASTNFFGAATTTSSTPLFGSHATTNVFGSTTFSTPSTQPSFFGNTVASTQSNVFGNFSTSATTASGGLFSNKTTFGQPAQSTFGGMSTFGSSGGSMFGGQSFSQQANPFQTSSPGSIFGGSPTVGSSTFQTGGQNVFGAAPTFATPAAGQPTFGTATFGGSATFGSPTKTFGSSPAGSAFGVSPQQPSTFENLANQDTVSFERLAQNQNQNPGFQQNQPFGATPQQPAFPSKPTTFGGSSFNTWR